MSDSTDPRPGADRASALDVFSTQVYGRPPRGARVDLSWELLAEHDRAELGIQRQYRFTLLPITGAGEWGLTILVDLPRETSSPVPALLGLNFQGNHATREDSSVFDLSPRTDPPPSAAWGAPLQLDGRGPEPSPRGAEARRWPVERATNRGWAVVTCCYLQLGPDSGRIHADGVHQLFERSDHDTRADDRWGAIGIWAWTLSRLLDALVAGMVPEIDAQRVCVFGHSRLGKAALWAGAQDERFAAVISNDSGALGAALSRPVGESPEMVARVFPHWFARRFAAWAPTDPPLIDQPALLACIAPRPLYVASANLDAHADPEGEFASWQQAAQAWPGGSAACAGPFPEPGERRHPTAVPLGYHLRVGEHDTLAFDWDGWLDFGDCWVR